MRMKYVKSAWSNSAYEGILLLADTSNFTSCLTPHVCQTCRLYTAGCIIDLQLLEVIGYFGIIHSAIISHMIL